MSTNKVPAKKVPSALTIGIARGGLEIKQFMRQRESVVFTIAFPIMLLAIFGSVFTNELTDGVTFSQYFVAAIVEVSESDRKSTEKIAINLILIDLAPI